MVLAEGTRVELVTAEPLSGRTHHQGDRFAIVVADNILLGGAVASPRGTKGVGEIVAARAKGGFGEDGRLTVRPLYLTLGQRQVALTAQPLNTKAASADGAGPVIVGAVTWLSIVVTGRTAELPAGAALTGYLARDLTFRVAAAPPPAAR
jgi:hypothetical protein